ncbi:MAG: glutamate-5-semialdehyde dehydrogenase [Acidobacteriota bacterium]|nr:MAG: glutamate-5-semialdehyde dehydrogenase [Acidobacteriota bacterium]
MTDRPPETTATYIQRICRQARLASRTVAALDSEIKTAALSAMAQRLKESRMQLQEANARDIEGARERGLSAAMVDRLALTDTRIEQMAAGIDEIALLRDPVGEVVSQWRRPGGFEVGQVRIPLGVIGMIYESRPNVTADASALCFKAGNATVLRGGSEAFHSNLAIATVIRAAISESGVDPNAVQVLETTDREAIGELLKQVDSIDLIIPRGGKGLIKKVTEESRIPVIKHYEGICHVYVHSEADLEMAVRIAVNAKVQRPSTCNAMETLLVDEKVADVFVPRIARELINQGVQIYGCPETVSRVSDADPATEESFRTEYLDLTCNIRVVEGFDQAVAHIQEFGSNHTDVIVTNSIEAARRFLRVVNSSSVMVNASSRLADGGVYGLGAEIGISTDKLHAYGPMGVTELTTKKFFVLGDGTLRT